MVDPKLLLLAVYLDRVQPVRFLFQINLTRIFNAWLRLKGCLFRSGWLVLVGSVRVRSKVGTRLDNIIN